MAPVLQIWGRKLLDDTAIHCCSPFERLYRCLQLRGMPRESVDYVKSLLFVRFFSRDNNHGKQQSWETHNCCLYPIYAYPMFLMWFFIFSVVFRLVFEMGRLQRGLPSHEHKKKWRGLWTCPLLKDLLYIPGGGAGLQVAQKLWIQFLVYPPGGGNLLAEQPPAGGKVSGEISTPKACPKCPRSALL